MLLRSAMAGLAIWGLVFASPAQARPPGDGSGGIFARAPRSKPKPKKPKRPEPAAAAALAGLTPGLTVRTSAGTTLGTVSQVVTGADGAIQHVVVYGSDGRTYTLSPNHLSIDGGVVTTIETAVGG